MKYIYKRNILEDWTPSLARWLKWNTYASRMNAKQSSIIGIVFRDNIGRLQYCLTVGRNVSDSGDYYDIYPEEDIQCYLR